MRAAADLHAEGRLGSVAGEGDAVVLEAVAVGADAQDLGIGLARGGEGRPDATPARLSTTTATPSARA